MSPFLSRVLTQFMTKMARKPRWPAYKVIVGLGACLSVVCFFSAFFYATWPAILAVVVAVWLLVIPGVLLSWRHSPFWGYTGCVAFLVSILSLLLNLSLYFVHVQFLKSRLEEKKGLSGYRDYVRNRDIWSDGGRACTIEGVSLRLESAVAAVVSPPAQGQEGQVTRVKVTFTITNNTGENLVLHGLGEKSCQGVIETDYGVWAMRLIFPVPGDHDPQSGVAQAQSIIKPGETVTIVAQGSTSKAIDFDKNYVFYLSGNYLGLGNVKFRLLISRGAWEKSNDEK